MLRCHLERKHLMFRVNFHEQTRSEVSWQGGGGGGGTFQSNASSRKKKDLGLNIDPWPTIHNNARPWQEG